MGKRQERHDLERLIGAARQARQALRFTREYVGERLLPEIEGWSWYDATLALEAALTPYGSVEIEPGGALIPKEAFAMSERDRRRAADHQRQPNEEAPDGRGSRRALCSCGWTGPWRVSLPSPAPMPQSDFLEHRDGEEIPEPPWGSLTGITDRSETPAWVDPAITCIDCLHPIAAHREPALSGNQMAADFLRLSLDPTRCRIKGCRCTESHGWPRYRAPEWDGGLWRDYSLTPLDGAPIEHPPIPDDLKRGESTVPVSGRVVSFDRPLSDGRVLTGLTDTRMPLPIIHPQFGAVGRISQSRLTPGDGVYVYGTMDARAFLEICDEAGHVDVAVDLDQLSSPPVETWPQGTVPLKGRLIGVTVGVPGSVEHLNGPHPDDVPTLDPEIAAYVRGWRFRFVERRDVRERLAGARSSRMTVMPQPGETWELPIFGARVIVATWKDWLWAYDPSKMDDEPVPMTYTRRVEAVKIADRPLLWGEWVPAPDTPKAGDTWDFPHNGPCRVIAVWRRYAWILLEQRADIDRGSPIPCEIEQLTDQITDGRYDGG